MRHRADRSRIENTPARFTKELHLAQRCKIWLHPKTLNAYLPQLSVFSNVRTLAITALITATFPSGSFPLYFGLVFPQVSRLRLLNPHASPTSLLGFILTFPRISHLEILRPRWTKCGNHPTLPLRDPRSIAFNGTLFLIELGEKFDEFASLLVKQGVRFKLVQFLRCGFSSVSAMRDFSDAISGTMAILRVAPLMKGKCTTVNECPAITHEQTRA